MKKLAVLCALTLASCNGYKLKEEERPYKVAPQDEAFFAHLVNEDGAIEPVKLENKDYPIEVQLYKNGRFFYHLPTLKDGDGWGHWQHESGHIHLFAERMLFVMNMDIRNVEGAGNQVAIEFADRKASRFLKLDQKK